MEQALALIVTAFQCAACMELLYQPLTLPCGFTICRRCFRRPSCKPLPTQQTLAAKPVSAAASLIPPYPTPFCPSADQLETPSTTGQSNYSAVVVPLREVSGAIAHDTPAITTTTTSTITASTLRGIPSSQTSAEVPAVVGQSAWDAEQEAAARAAVDCIGAYICPVKACRRQHRFRGECVDVVLSTLLERIFPDEVAALQAVMQGELRLKQYWNPKQPMCQVGGVCDDGSSDPTSCTAQQKHQELMAIITDCFAPVIAQCPHLQLPYVICAKIYAELGRFDEATAHARHASMLNPSNRRGLITEKLVVWRQRMHESQLHILATCAISALYSPDFHNDNTGGVAQSVQTAVEDLRTEIYSCIDKEVSSDRPASQNNGGVAAAGYRSNHISNVPCSSMSDPGRSAVVVAASDICIDSALSSIPPSLLQTLKLLSIRTATAYPDVVASARAAESMSAQPFTSMTTQHKTLSSLPPISCLIYSRISDSLITPFDLECHLCLSPMVSPVTCPCGHSWCKNCLLKSLDHSRDCPMCRSKLPPIGYFMRRPTNRIMELLGRTMAEAAHQRRSMSTANSAAHNRLASPSTLLNAQGENAASSTVPYSLFGELADDGDAMIEGMDKEAIEEPEASFGSVEKIPIFVCSLVFPGSSQGYHMFEPRYRVLIKRCLEGNRRFGMVMPRPSCSGGSLCMDHGTLVYIKHFEPLLSCDIVSTVEGNLPRYVVEVTALHRFRILSMEKNSAGYMEGYVERVEDIEPEDECTNSSLHRPETTLPLCSLSQAPLSRTFSQSHPSSQGTEQQQVNHPPLRSQEWDPSALVTLVYRARRFISGLLASLPPAARLHFDRQHGAMPSDPADLSFWLAEFLPLNPYILYALLPLKSVTERMALICTWIEQTSTDHEHQLQLQLQQQQSQM
ncbi:hypothetical protein BASA50_000411 [Batrachochytrium salamandrivorans]|uniref:RING-type domain-containing protein n=1 Tax=Batrachochytrium salamandrivorans TaxID=1357716 RepID=A0ABQ8EWS6_9FUNG|nr:hypothetical protein BASA50_000411 [Batrachochytrium salamandrivorans]KAH9275478.1 hypothetical protein BASA83_002252 [Batrachochytrium salamandrivorans]KAJ1345159.1 hypothetical protein BSLG_000674 [Batrachochytrium salamandrivorans]